MSGFTIRCKNLNSGGKPEDVVVTDEEAEKLDAECDYFHHVFAHGTRETAERILVKPDWSPATAKQVIELIVHGKTSVTSIETFLSLEAAAEQLLIEMVPKVPSFVEKESNSGGSIVLREAAVTFLELIQSPTRLTLETSSEPFAHSVWTQLLAIGVAIVKEDCKSLPIVLAPKPDKRKKPSTELEARLQGFSCIGVFPFGIGTESTSKYIAHTSASHSLGSLMRTICDALHTARPPKPNTRVFLKEEFSLRVPTSIHFRLCLQHTLKEAFESTGAKLYFHKGNSIGYYLDGSNNGCPTIAGTITQLKHALSIFREEWIETYNGRLSSETKECKRCALRICAPRSETLDHLENSVRACQNNPNTLGVDVSSKCFFAVKTLNDMKLLLNALEGNINRSVVSSSYDDCSTGKSPITLSTLNYPKGVF